MNFFEIEAPSEGIGERLILAPHPADVPLLTSQTDARYTLKRERYNSAPGLRHGVNTLVEDRPGRKSADGSALAPLAAGLRGKLRFFFLFFSLFSRFPSLRISSKAGGDVGARSERRTDGRTDVAVALTLVTSAFRFRLFNVNGGQIPNYNSNNNKRSWISSAME